MAKNKQPGGMIIPFVLISAIVLVAFLGGRISSKISGNKQSIGAEGRVVTFVPELKTASNLQFFVMSFCPYGNQAETVLKPVANLLKDTNLELTPHYIFNKVNLADFESRCDQQVFTVNRCADYVAKGYFPDAQSCEAQLYVNKQECMNDQGLIIGESAYTSLHGLGELKQGIREVCAYQNLGSDKSSWWDFVDKVNSNCAADNIESCWESQALGAGLNLEEIKNCLSARAQKILDEEIAVSEKYQASASPTFIINDLKFPPDNAYPGESEGSVSLKIGSDFFTPDQYRSPEVLKTAVCAGWQNQPPECQEKLEDTAAGSSGGC
ncbi:MAG: hypothetical protein ABIB61_00375 [Candidatus Shapirobacteria bacterium]